MVASEIGSKDGKLDMPSRCILVTGGAGYIGSHTVIELLTQTDYSVVIIDNLINSSKECLSRLEKLSEKSIPVYTCDLLNKSSIDTVFEKHNIWCVIHFAGLKAVGESVKIPHTYYKNNIVGTLNLTQSMEEHNVRNIIFSSSATVYGEPQYLPIDESHPVGSCTNPYGKTKYFIETILNDIAAADNRWNVINLRYFNPVGAHHSGSIGENPQGLPNNLMPFVSQVAVGKRPCLQVFGDDYDTTDGTGVRDYIHVVDLARGHISALKQIEENCGCKVYNLGTGRPYSVLQMIQAFEKASGKKINYKVVGRRAGDTACVYADVSLAQKELNWVASKDIDEMCKDTWKWQSLNPKGYAEENGH